MHNNERSMRRELEETLPFRDHQLVILLWSWLRELRDSLQQFTSLCMSMLFLNCERNVVINVSDSCLVPPRYYSTVQFPLTLNVPQAWDKPQRIQCQAKHKSLIMWVELKEYIQPGHEFIPQVWALNSLWIFSWFFWKFQLELLNLI